MKEYWNNLSTGQKAKYIFFGVVGLIVLLFAIFNWQVIELHLVFGKIEIPVTILILISMLGGYAYAKLFGMQKARKQDKELSYLKGELAARKEKKSEETNE